MVLIVLCLIIGSGFAHSENVTVPESEKVRAFQWKNSFGNEMLTIHTKEKIHHNELFSNKSEYKFKPTTEKGPLPPPSGWMEETFQVLRTEVKTKQLLNQSNRPVVYIVGESHLGPVQKTVTQVLVTLINEKEIDAVLLEQPDNLNFGLDRYAEFNNNPDKAIASMQFQLINQADAFNIKPKSLGKYSEYFTNVKSEEDVMMALTQINSKFGEKGIKEAMSLIQSRLDSIEKLEKLETDYNSSRYISASDYLYIMTQLKGLRLPFHAIESVEERDKFQKIIDSNKGKEISKRELLPRDRYMAKQTDSLIRKNGYLQVILICGAYHTENLQNLIQEMGYEVKVAYQVEDKKFKPRMAVLDNPNYVLGLINNTPKSFVPDAALILNNKPSMELEKQVRDLVNSASPALDSGQNPKLMNEFFNQYSSQSLRNKPTWDLPVTLENGSVAILRKDNNKNQLSLQIEAPVNEVNLSKSIQPNISQFNLAKEDYEHLKDLQKLCDSCKIVTVLRSKNIEMDRLFAFDSFGKGFSANSTHELIQKIANATNSNGPFNKLIFDLKDFTDLKAAAFKTAIRKEKSDKLIIGAMPRSEKQIAQLRAITDHNSIAWNHPPTLSPITTIKTGNQGVLHKFTVLVATLTEGLGKILITYTSPNNKVMNFVHSYVTSRLSSPNSLQGKSLAEVIHDSKMALKKAGLAEDNLRITIETEGVSSDFVNNLNGWKYYASK
ncbi:MAG: hypothetical protein HQL95_00930 [Magnetococcales bacterium]|nr:hypothetical protein [Magnetococcales bacterium]